MGRYSGKRCRLISMFTMTAGFFLVEIIVGYITNSMALVADSFHMLSDVAALIIAFLSVRMSPKKWSKNTFGWARAEVLGALVNAVFLVALCFSIFVESMKRFYQIEKIYNPQMILIVGAMGLVVNIIGLFLFHEHGGSHGHSHGGRHRSLPTLDQVITEDMNLGEVNFASLNGDAPDKHQHNAESSSQMNMRGVFLHVMADALGSVIVIISAIVIWKTDFEYRFYIDPALSVVMVILILRSVWPLLVDSALILLQTVPTHIQVDDIQKKLLRKVDGVLAVHEFHVWQLAGDRIIASAHIRCRNLADYMKIAEKVKEFFHNEGIHSTTIQPEFVEEQLFELEKEKSNCVLDCPPNTQCSAQTCCGPQGRSEPSGDEDGMSIRQRTNASGSCASVSGGSQSSNNGMIDSSNTQKESNTESDIESGKLLSNSQNYNKDIIS